MSIFQRFLGKRPEKEITDDSWQTPMVQDICMAMLRLIPDDWNSVALVLDVTDKGIGSGLAHSAITPQPVSDAALRDDKFVMPDVAVMVATRKLELGWVERKKTFKRAIISARRDGEDWEIRSEYEHE